MGGTCQVPQDKKSIFDGLLPYLRVAKIPLCMMVAFSASFGFVMASPMISLQLFMCTFAVFLLSAGAASYNSFQEKDSDGLMARTKNRPLVVKEVIPFHAAVQASVLIFFGLLLLVAGFDGGGPALVGLISVIFYNFLYTKLKRTTVLAIVPGAICGALPPYIGWLSGGGHPFAYSAAIIFILFVLWQIPHFFLVQLNHKSDYVNSMSPNMLKMLQEGGLRRLFVTWIGALSACMLFFPVIPGIISNVEKVFICGNAILLFVLFVIQLFYSKNPNYRFLFIYLNFSIFFIMFIVIVGKLGQS
jgi:heme o synthase